MKPPRLAVLATAIAHIRRIISTAPFPLALAAVVVILMAVGGWQSLHRPALTLVDKQSHTTSAKSAAKQPTAGTTSSTATVPAPAVTPPSTAAKPTTAPVESGGTLIFSPASVIIYKRPSGVDLTIKAYSSYSQEITVSASDGKAINLPWSAASAGQITTTTKDPTPYKLSWPMSTEPSYNTIGVHVYTLSASSASGTKYTGSITVDVRPMPILTTSATSFVANVAGEQTDIQFNNGGDYAFDFSAVSAFMPTLTISVGSVSCTGSLDPAETSMMCSDGSSNMDVPPGTYSATCTFENEFQKIVIPGTIYAAS